MTSVSVERRPRGRPRKDPTAPPTPPRARAEQVEPVDLHIGRTLRAARTMRGFSREALAQRVGLGKEALEKYERGEARVLSSRLWAFSRILDVPVGFFFDGFAPGSPPAGSEELLQAMSVGNMQLLLALNGLKFDQRQMVKGLVEGLTAKNAADAAGAADAA